MQLKFGKSKIFLFLCLAFIAGVGLGRLFNHQIMAVLAMIVVICLTVWWKDPQFMFAGCLVLVLIFGAVRYQTYTMNQEANFIGNFYKQNLEFTGVVSKEPDERSDKTNLTVQPDGYAGQVLLGIGPYYDFQYGDRVKVSGKLGEPAVYEDFSYKDYLSRYDTFAVMYFPKVEKIGTGGGNHIRAALLDFKQRCREVMAQMLPEPHNALIMGIILGLKRALPEDLKNALIVTGVSHIIVISGYNMTIITKLLDRTRQWIGRRAAFALSILTILAFVLMTGADASVVRAAIMASLFVLALNIGRVYQTWNALVFVAALMVFQNPRILVFDVGFQLSFMATAGLVLLGDRLQNKFSKIPEAGILSLRTNLSSTLAAQIFTLPLLVFYFDQLSTVAVVTNLLILWTVPYAMYLGFAAVFLGLKFLPLAKIVAATLWLVLGF